MERQISDNAGMTRLLVIALDFLLINALFYACAYFDLVSASHLSQLLWNVAYFISVYVFQPVAGNRLVKVEQIINKAALTATMMAVIYDLLQNFVKLSAFRFFPFLICLICMTVTITVSRALCRFILKSVRRNGRNKRTVVFVGAGVNLSALYKSMSSNLATGYHVVGYFEDVPSKHLPQKLARLGVINDVISYLESHHADMLFCNLPSSRSEEILAIMNYCENHLVRFYSVPNVRNYVHRAMTVEFIEDTPVLSLRYEPLRNPVNRMIKRTFDIVVSGLFIVLCFWWVYLLVALITKITMPGPVLFKQKRNGINGEEFTCLKFRSMKVNADADRLQATKDDPRKTKWGNIMRKTNIDELPQFLNVFLGDMSVVGPRPHMVKHTEEYGALVDKYMVRHFAKPGITGWAQVTGSRGETSELWMMEERIQKDIWYVENWSLLLDIKIIIKTVTNVFGGEKGNAY